MKGKREEGSLEEKKKERGKGGLIRVFMVCINKSANLNKLYIYYPTAKELSFWMSHNGIQRRVRSRFGCRHERGN